jgi:tetratricopeptide (TPR) repeat protein
VFPFLQNTKILLFLGLLGATQYARADNFEFSPNLKTAYKACLNLRLAEAKKLTIAERVQHRNALAADYVDDYADFFKLFITEEKKEYDRLTANEAYRLDRIEKLGDEKSPYHRYMQAQIRLHWAIVKVKFEDYVSAGLDIKKAYNLLEENQKLFPNFVANKSSLGVLHAVVGTIPDDYKWTVSLVGMSGTIAQGQREIEEVIAYSRKNDFLFEEETIVMYAFLLLHLGNKSEDAWRNVRSPKLNAATNPLACFVQANVAMHTGRTDEAIKLLEKCPEGADFQPFVYMNYMLGLAKLYKGDKDAAVYLQRFVTNFKGLHYIKDAYLKLAWEAALRDDAGAYAKFLAGCRTNGKATTESDKKALRDAKSGVVPNKILLRARLLFDGGFFQKALAQLAAFEEKNFTTTATQLEYLYRLGRIHDKLGNEAEAIDFYTKTITRGKTETYYFACNAALQLGIFYENQKKYAEARTNFNLCLSLSPSEYKDGLHQKAKAGLNRLKKNK